MRSIIRFNVLAVIFSLVVSSAMLSAQAHNQTGTIDSATVAHVLAVAKQQLNATLVMLNHNIAYPRSTDSSGMWKTVPPPDWTVGFFPGCLWYLSEMTHYTAMRSSARRWTDGLTAQQYLTKTHDIGFIMNCSFGKGLQFQGIESYKPILLQSAQSLMTRFNPNVGCIKSWDGRKWPYPVIIDNMMNLELLLWAEKNGGTKEMYSAALSHATKTMQNHFREDGSTYHVVDYDTLTGNVVSKVTHQGYADESVWARGQAWAVYGFAMMFRETGEDAFLKTAEKAADWFLTHLPDDKIPYWDFLSPAIPDEKRDASAASIASSALFELSALERDKERKEKYYRSAVEILRSLCSPAYLSDGTTTQGIILHSVGNYPKSLEIDVSLIYTDYYFLEALYRYVNGRKQ